MLSERSALELDRGMAVVPTPPNGSRTVVAMEREELDEASRESLVETAGWSRSAVLAICHTVFVYSLHSSLLAG